MFLFWKDKAEHLEIESKKALQLTIPVPGAKTSGLTMQSSVGPRPE